MKRFRHLLTVLLLLCATVASAHDFVSGGICYNITSSTNLEVSVTYHDQYATTPTYTGAVTIPATVTYNGKTYSVTSIGNKAFSDCSLTSITIPESVTSIGGSAFYNCSSLTSITIPESVASIGDHAFYGCSSLTAITIPESVTSIGGGAFSGCTSLTAITIPESVTSIGVYTFYKCRSLTAITIPESVTSIGNFAFEGCTSLKEVIIEDGSETLSLGYNYDSNSREGLFYDCPLESIYIGRNLSYSSGSSYGYSPFYRDESKLTTLTIGEKVTSIGEYAFYGCSSLTSIIIPKSVTSIGRYAFYDCENLKTVFNYSDLTLQEDESDYGYVAYYADRVFNVDESIGDYAFKTKDGVHYLIAYIGNGTELTLPTDYKGENYTIKGYAFSNCTEIRSLTIPSKVKGIEEYAFYDCDVIKVFWLTNTPPVGYEHLCGKINYVSNNLYTELENRVEMPFLSTRFEVDGVCFVPTSVADRKCCIVDYNPSTCKGEVTTVDTVMYQGKLEFEVNDVMPYAFYKNEKMSVLTLQNLGKIGASAFEGCAALEKVNIPVSITQVEDYAFRNCAELKDAVFADRETLLPLGKQLFADSPLATLYLGAKIAYISEASEENSPFCNNRFLKSVVITNVESDIYDYEFYGCSGLQSAEVGDGVERIGRWAFSGCSSLTDFVFGSNVTSIGEEAFSDCVNMTNITGRAILPPVCGAQALDDINKLKCTLTVPERNLTSYQNAEQWKEFPFISNLVTEDNYVTYVIDGEVYKTLLLTPGERIVAPYVADREGMKFSGWDMKEYMQPIAYPAQAAAMRAAARTIVTETLIDLAGKLYTNAPCTNTQWGDQFTSWDVLFDNNPETFFHSEYGNKQTPDGLDHYIRVDMGEGNAIGTFKFTYTTRFDKGGYVMGVSPRTIVVEGSNIADGSYTEIATLTALSQEGSYQYISDELGSESTPYRYIRFRVIANHSGQSDNGHPYFAISEFGMWKIEHETVEPEPGPTPDPEPEPTPDPEFGYTIPIMPDRDITIYGSFTRNEYNVTYLIDGKIHCTCQVKPGDIIPAIETPTKEGHTFSGWSEIPETMPSEDITITGTFSVNSYTITYKVDGEEYKTVTVSYGAKIPSAEEPTKEGYTFSGWSEILETMPAEDVTITGTFSVNKYTVTYKVDGEEYKILTVTYGTEIPSAEEPTKEGYTFSGWSDYPRIMPAHDIEITGTFTNINQSSYTVTYMVDGKKYKTVTVVYGAKIPAMEEPTKEGYTFSGWSNLPTTMPAEDITVTGTFTVNSYTVTYMVDGKKYKTVTVVYGAKIPAMEEPTKEGYTFSGWSNLPTTMPAEDITVTGTFTVNNYTITYMVDGKKYKTVTVAYDAEIPAIEEPTKVGHTFSGWDDLPWVMPAEDITVTGTFTVNNYTVTYMVDGKKYKTVSVAYGAKIPAMEEPTKAGYTFSGWSNLPATMPAEDITVTGTFTEDDAAVDGVFVDEDEQVVYDLNGVRILNTENLEKGIYIVGGKKVVIK